MNKIKVNFEIDNCCDCPNHYTEKIYTPDSFEHEEGVYCSKVNDKDSYNKKHKLYDYLHITLLNYFSYLAHTPHGNIKLSLPSIPSS